MEDSTTFTCNRCNKTFDRKFNYDRHISKRQKQCKVVIPQYINVSVLVGIIQNVRYPIHSSDVEHVWRTICYVQEIDPMRVFHLAWHIIENCTLEQVKCIVEYDHVQKMKHTLRSIHAHLLSLHSSGVLHIHSKSIQDLIDLFSKV